MPFFDLIAVLGSLSSLIVLLVGRIEDQIDRGNYRLKVRQSQEITDQRLDQIERRLGDIWQRIASKDGQD